MKEILGTASVEVIKRKLKSYAKENLVYNQPHVDERCYDRYKMGLGEFEKQLLNPQNLVFVEIQESKNPNFDRVYALYFAVSKSTTYLIPVSFKPKVLYVITVIKIKRKWQKGLYEYAKKQL